MDNHVIELPSGGTCTLRDVRTLRGGDKRRITISVADAGVESNAAYMLTARAAVARALIVAWDIPYAPGAKLPSEEPTTFDDLELADYDKIFLHDVVTDAVILLWPRPVTPDDAAEPGSPTEPAAA